MNFLTYILEHYYSYTNSKMIDVDRRFMFSDAHRYYLLYDTRKLTCNEFIKIAHVSTVEIVLKKKIKIQRYIFTFKNDTLRNFSRFLYSLNPFFQSRFLLNVLFVLISSRWCHRMETSSLNKNNDPISGKSNETSLSTFIDPSINGSRVFSRKG